MGISQVPEGRRLFGNLCVHENLILGAYLRFKQKDRKRIQRDFEFVYRTFPKLGEKKKQLAASLSGGEQQMLAIGRGLMSRPKLLLLDEPSIGLAPLLVQEIFKVVKVYRKKASQSCWWSRMQEWLWPQATGDIFWNWGKWY